VRLAKILLSSTTATVVWKLFSAVRARALSRPTCLHAARATRSQHYWPLPVHTGPSISGAHGASPAAASSSSKRFEYDAPVTRARGACTATVRYIRRHPTFVKRFCGLRDIVDINSIIFVVTNLLFWLIVAIIIIRNTDRVTGPFYFIFSEHVCALVDVLKSLKWGTHGCRVLAFTFFHLLQQYNII